MGAADDQNDQFDVADFVHDPVVSHPGAPEALQVTLQRGAEMGGGLGQPVDGCNDPRPIRPGHAPEVPEGALLNPYREAHAVPDPSPAPDPWDREAG